MSCFWKDECKSYVTSSPQISIHGYAEDTSTLSRLRYQGEVTGTILFRDEIIFHYGQWLFWGIPVRPEIAVIKLPRSGRSVLFVLQRQNTTSNVIKNNYFRLLWNWNFPSRTMRQRHFCLQIGRGFPFPPRRFGHPAPKKNKTAALIGLKSNAFSRAFLLVVNDFMLPSIVNDIIHEFTVTVWILCFPFLRGIREKYWLRCDVKVFRETKSCIWIIFQRSSGSVNRIYKGDSKLNMNLYGITTTACIWRYEKTFNHRCDRRTTLRVMWIPWDSNCCN